MSNTIGLDTTPPHALGALCEQLLRPCAKCGHARIDHEHGHTERTWCAVDMGGERCEPCACDTYEVTP